MVAGWNVFGVKLWASVSRRPTCQSSVWLVGVGGSSVAHPVVVWKDVRGNNSAQLV